jgi:16S rRNA (guanine966-N2)-methyltransferase
VTRVVAGTWGGRKLETPKGDRTRPTSDRVREAMFSTLESLLGGWEYDSRVFDLYAGSGALGIEALSRGANTAVFVESDRRAAAVIKRNLAALGTDSGAVLRMSVERFLEGPMDRFDVAFIDPPYDLSSELLGRQIARLADMREPDSVIVVERSTRTPFNWPDGVSAIRDKAYGETHLWYGR